MNQIEAKIDHLVRPNIRNLKPYASARDEAPQGLQSETYVWLDANENSFGGPLEEDYSRYPDPLQLELKQQIANLKGLDTGQIFLGNGSDEAIDLLFRAFVEPGRDHVILLPPTYGMYSVQANIHGAEIRLAPLRPDFSPDPAAVRNQMSEQSRLLFLCSPNNPTGQCLPESFILEMLRDFPGLVVVDEAYADFSDQVSWSARINDFPNLVVLQTLSKAWGLAGLRIGMAFANPLIINILNKVKYPYNLNVLTTQMAREALANQPIKDQKVAQILSERRRLEAALPLLDGVLRVFPSDANFLLIQVRDANGLYSFLASKGIIVRNRSREMHCENCLRITVGTHAENTRLLEAISYYSNC